MDQIIVNSLITSSGYLLVGIGFALIYSTTRFFHFAHGVVLTLGAYFVFLLTSWLGINYWAAILLSISFCAILGCLMEAVIYRPLRRKQASPLILLLASLGIYIILQNFISMIFGSLTKTIRRGIIEEGIPIFDARITYSQLCILAVSIALLVGTIILLKRSKIGLSMRAIANLPELANLSGVKVNKVILYTFGIGSALAGLTGILTALNVDMNPLMGLNLLMMGVVAVVIGGTNNILGVAFGAVLLGFAQNLVAWQISSEWKDPIAFIILFIFLLIRPQGFLGKKVKKAIV